MGRRGTMSASPTALGLAGTINGATLVAGAQGATPRAGGSAKNAIPLLGGGMGDSETTVARPAAS